MHYNKTCKITFDRDQQETKVQGRYGNDTLAWHGAVPGEWDMVLISLSDVPPYLARQPISHLQGYGDIFLDDLLKQCGNRMCWSTMRDLDAFFHAKRLELDLESVLLVGEWNLSDSFSRNMEKHGVVDLDRLVQDNTVQMPNEIARAAAMIRILDEGRRSWIYKTIESELSLSSYLNILRKDSDRSPYFIDGMSFGYLTGGNVDEFVGLIDDDVLYWLGEKACIEFDDDVLMQNAEYARYARKIELSDDIVELWKPLVRSFRHKTAADGDAQSSTILSVLGRRDGKHIITAS